MMRAFGGDSHFKQIKAYLTANVFALIVGRYIHISRFIERSVGRFTVIIKIKQVKFKFRAEKTGNTGLPCFLGRLH